MWIFYSHGSLCPNFLACEHWFLVRSCSWAFEATGNLLVKPFFMSVSRIQTKRRQRKKMHWSNTPHRFKEFVLYENFKWDSSKFYINENQKIKIYTKNISIFIKHKNPISEEWTNSGEKHKPGLFKIMSNQILIM